MCTLTPETFADIADDALAGRIIAGLDGPCLEDGRVADDMVAFFLGGGGELGLWLDLDEAADATICQRIASVLVEQQPYHLDPQALLDLDLEPDDVDELAARLALAGDVSADLTVPEDRVAYFLDIRHALDFTVEGYEDYAKDIFFLLHTVATQISAATSEIIARLEQQADTQRRTLVGALQDAFGIPADTVEATCEALCGSLANAIEVLVAPVLASAGSTGQVTAVPADSRFRRTVPPVGPVRRFAAKLGLSGVETEVAFRDQDLVGKFPERLALPPGLATFDALLPSADGHVYLFSGDTYWRYSAATYALEDVTAAAAEHPVDRIRPARRRRRRIRRLHRGGVADRAGPDRAPVARSAGIRGSSRMGRDRAALGQDPQQLRRPRPHRHGLPRRGRARRTCSPATSTSATPRDDFAHVDEGYPRTIAANWPAEGMHSTLPSGFETAVGASFQGLDGRTYVFKDGRYAASGRRDRTPGRAALGPGPQHLRRRAADRRRLHRRRCVVPASRATRSSATSTPSRTRASGSRRATHAAWRSTSGTCRRSSRAGSRQPSRGTAPGVHPVQGRTGDQPDPG